MVDWVLSYHDCLYHSTDTLGNFDRRRSLILHRMTDFLESLELLQRTVLPD
jgi:hypothetical protein